MFFQISHLFNVAHNLRLLVQKERSLDIMKVGVCGGWTVTSARCVLSVQLSDS